MDNMFEMVFRLKIVLFITCVEMQLQLKLACYMLSVVQLIL